ncbi:tyrosine-type recombinase/integrase [Gordonia sp. ABKF26]|uniref:tyrosine-type recombinase/integrase n=1 Tax=Gordonia sp. ABKF26 TaxID=3238687 RepID=UPI0034E3FE5B
MTTRGKPRQRRRFGKIRQLPSGRYQASYADPGGNQLRHVAPRTYDAKLDAEGWLAAESRLIQLGEWVPPAERVETRAAKLVTFREFAEQWLIERDLAPKTRALYRGLLDSRILPVLGDERLSDITPALIRTWWAGLGKETPTRSAHAYQLTKTIFATAAGDKLVSENPCQIKNAGKPPKRRDIELLTLPELRTVTAAMPERYQVAVPVLAWCGLRFGELIELRRKDVVRRDSSTVLRIRRAATLVDNELVVGPPKSDAGVRDIHVPPHVAQLLTEHMAQWTGHGPESFVFTTTRGKRLSASAFTKTYKLAVAKVGKPQMRIHDLRHTGATLAAQAGATTKELMARIGHTTPEMAMRYQHAAADRDAAIAARLSELAEES